MVRKKISRKIILEFYQDIQRWESMVGYAANELLFLDTLLHAKAFENTAQIKTEKMLCFKLEIKTKNQEVNELKTQMELSKNNVGAFLDCEVNSGIEFSFKDYKVLKRNFGLFNTSYNQYKTEIFKHTGGIL
ncbi:hypothetical protein [uncultured Kriegella sp.]|uniref:hypothetical protein n=1 Tax=uncultured Kriegella sp. TaxID=1798910 RepID=UPI0030DBDCA3